MADLMPGSDMEVRTAIQKARIWWEQGGGRKEMSKKLNATTNQQWVGCKFTPATDTAAAILIKGNKEAVIASGILQGHKWDLLTKREQIQIVKVWHQFHVLNPLRGMANDQKRIIQ